MLMSDYLMNAILKAGKFVSVHFCIPMAYCSAWHTLGAQCTVVKGC